MNDVEMLNDTALKETVQGITARMNDMDTTTDGVQIFVNPWGRWCAKYKTRQGVVFYSFGSTMLEALEGLRDNPTIEPSCYSRE